MVLQIAIKVKNMVDRTNYNSRFFSVYHFSLLTAYIIRVS